jgi:hypothetical protein
MVGKLFACDAVTVTVTNADLATVLNAINAGGAAYTNAQGLTYRADTWFSGGNVSSTGTAFAATADGALYQTERSGSFSYNIPVAGGSQNYLVALKFAESVATGPGQRVFDVAVNGILMVNNLDLFSQAGANTAFDLVIPVTTSSDILSIQFQPDAASGLGAKVDAIMVGAAQVLPPAPPANLIANAVSSSEIDLNWADNSANETSFQVEVSTDGNAYTLLASLGANVTGYTHGGLNPSMTYYYRVRACNASGCSSYAIANTQTQGAPPTAPGNLTLSAAGANQINLAWRDNSSNEDGFVIERSLNGVAFTVIAVTGPNVSMYGAAGLQPNTRYYFRVRAFNSIGSSAYSNTANVRTKAK